MKTKQVIIIELTTEGYYRGQNNVNIHDMFKDLASSVEKIERLVVREAPKRKR